MPGRFPPRLFGLTAASVVATYRAVNRASSTSLNIWDYGGDGSFISEVKADLTVAAVTHEQFNQSLQIIRNDPAAKVADGSLLWLAGTTLYVYDPVADTIYSIGSASSPRWGRDGWIYYASTSQRLHRVRADLTDDEDLSGASGPFVGTPGFALTTSALYVGLSALDSVQDLARYPLAGGTPTDNSASPPAGWELNEPGDSPLWCGGFALGSSRALWAATSQADTAAGIHLLDWTAPDSNTDLFPNSWAEWLDPNAGGDKVLGLDLSDDNTEAVLYPVNNGGGLPGILRTDLTVKDPGDPLGLVLVESYGGAYPDYMLLL